MPKKSNFTLGLEAVLNNKDTSFLTQPKVFYEVQQQSGMPISEMLKTIGKSSKEKKKSAEPTEDEKAQARLAKMETK